MTCTCTNEFCNLPVVLQPYYSTSTSRGCGLPVVFLTHRTRGSRIRRRNLRLGVLRFQRLQHPRPSGRRATARLLCPVFPSRYPARAFLMVLTHSNTARRMPPFPWCLTGSRANVYTATYALRLQVTTDKGSGDSRAITRHTRILCAGPWCGGDCCCRHIPDPFPTSPAHDAGRERVPARATHAHNTRIPPATRHLPLPNLVT